LSDDMTADDLAYVLAHARFERAAAAGLPAERRCALLEAVAAELRDRPKFSDAELLPCARRSPWFASRWPKLGL